MTPKLRQFVIDALLSPVAGRFGAIACLAAEELDAERAPPLIAKVNKFSLDRMAQEDVEIRGCNSCNNLVDSYDSRFTLRSLGQVARLTPGSPMALGHDVGGWAYAMTFAADRSVNEEGERLADEWTEKRKAVELRDAAKASWVRQLFYWPKKASYSADLAARIGSGLAREVSLHWRFDKATCSVCNGDMRKCPHMPGEEYDGKRCFYEMDDVTEVLETSFVVRGGQHGTSIWNIPFGAGGARSLPEFGEAIREAKADRETWSEWTRALKERTTRQTGVERWLAQSGGWPRA